MYWIWGKIRNEPDKGKWVKCVCFDKLYIAIAYAKQRVGEFGGEIIIKNEKNCIIENIFE